VIPEFTPPASHPREVPFYTNMKIIIPVLISLGFLLGLGVAVFIHWKSKYERLVQMRQNFVFIYFIINEHMHEAVIQPAVMGEFFAW
jgi:hypothetical protein